MKRKWLALLLCMAIGLSLAACGQQDSYLYFDSKRSMLQHLKGVWHGDGTYYFIHNEEMYVLTGADIEEYATLAIAKGIQNNPGLYKKLNEWEPEIYTRYFNEVITDTAWPISDVDYDKGEFCCMETQWVIRESGLEMAGKDETLKKLSDTPKMESEWLQGAFKRAIGNYEVKLSDFVLSPTEYAAKLKSSIPKIGQYMFVGTNDGVSTYTENGRGIYECDAWLLSSPTTLMWYDHTRATGYMLAHVTQDDDRCAVMVSTTNRSQDPDDMDEKIKAALLCLGNYPIELSVKEVKERFEKEGQLVGNKKTWSATVGEVEYSMEMDDKTQAFIIIWKK